MVNFEDVLKVYMAALGLIDRPFIIYSNFYVLLISECTMRDGDQ